jgi:hypothetical protein
MLSVNAAVLVQFARDLAQLEIQAASLAAQGGGGPASPIPPNDVAITKNMLERVQAAIDFFYLPATDARRYRFLAALDANPSYADVRHHLHILREALEDELQTRLVFFMPAGRAIHYIGGQGLLGDEVIKRFPDLGTDIEEAGKCLGCGRSTAAVFHLMRVLEVGVQSFGATFNVASTDQKNWQPILNEVNTALNAMPKSDPGRARFAELVTLLTAVKFAWRNEVMHPKGVYTEEEAEEIFRATKSFMRKIAAACTIPSESRVAQTFVGTAEP